MGSIHDDGVLYLGVADSGMVVDCCVGAYVGVRPDGAVVADDGGTSYGCPAVDDGAPAYGDVVCYGCCLFHLGARGVILAIYAYSILILYSLRSPPPPSAV